jgi:hypothetical protein
MDAYVCADMWGEDWRREGRRKRGWGKDWRREGRRKRGRRMREREFIWGEDWQSRP